jgi:hypothetical protein
MQRLKTRSLAVLSVTLPAALLMLVSGFINDQVDEIDRTRASRSRVQTQIHEIIHSRYSAAILETRLRSRCGITAYIVKVRDNAGNAFTLYYDINDGKPVRFDLLNGCTGRATPRTRPGIQSPSSLEM